MTAYLDAAPGYVLFQVRQNSGTDFNIRESAIVGWAVSETNFDVRPIFLSEGPNFTAVPSPPTSPYTPGSFLGIQRPGGEIEAVRIGQSVSVTQLFPGTRLPRTYQNREDMFTKVRWLIGRIMQPSDIA